VKICGASIATRTGSHMRCLLAEEHRGECDPKIHNPRNLPTSDLLRLSSAMLRDVGAQVAEELAVRALRLDQAKAKAQIALRRGHKVSQELLDLLDEIVPS
jgi:hypothetical protein